MLAQNHLRARHQLQQRGEGGEGAEFGENLHFSKLSTIPSLNSSPFSAVGADVQEALVTENSKSREVGGGGAQCLGASTFSSFSKCFGNRFFCIFCKPYTYSHPFLPTLVSYKKIWPIYGFARFSVTKKEQN